VNTFKQKESRKKTETKPLPTETEKTEEPGTEERPRGQLLLDATCVPSDIAYPTDLDLLNQAREKAVPPDGIRGKSGHQSDGRIHPARPVKLGKLQ